MITSTSTRTTLRLVQFTGLWAKGPCPFGEPGLGCAEILKKTHKNGFKKKTWWILKQFQISWCILPNSWLLSSQGGLFFRSLPNPTGPKSHRCYRSGEECEILKVWILLRDGWRSPWRSFFKNRYHLFCPNLLKQRLNHKTMMLLLFFFHGFLLKF